MVSHDDLIEHVVTLQLTSPKFAEYCVAHVTDPKHRFLFTDDDSTERQLYTRLLEQTALTAVPPTPTAPSAGALRPHAAVLWSALLEHFSTPQSVCGPHMPHMFRTTSALEAFLDSLDATLSAPSAAEALVQHMARRIPMTETFLYVLWFRADALARRAESLESAGTILYVSSLLRHTHATRGAEAASYQSVFDVYLERIAETVWRAAAKGSGVETFVEETAAGWAASAALSEGTLQHLTHTFAKGRGESGG